MMGITELPDEIDFLCFFENEPFLKDIQDNITFGYEYKKRNVTLLFYFTALEGRVTLMLKVDDVNVMVQPIRYVEIIRLDKNTMIIKCNENSGLPEISVQLEPTILIKNHIPYWFD
ncbi:MULTISPECIES: hypothetical protein [Providencia]|uniref:Uncharacterized protein n=2 Tax=Providencia TaxID=586 RepID=A0AAE2ZF64_PRORE|nr:MULTISPECIES: hypothetical protein [Providencia]MRF64932.1 hypothetical protein [Escherichia coli]QIF64957.1 hypothetical protein FVA72_05240 [Providencia sp. 1709051003]MBG5928586.1 hypothetical protein [Providencia rettgeri]MBW3118932.1 hypothetical protein [Providencia rettgeri]NHN52259.1 hypothetical protein [Providencia rettgeri]